MKRLVLSMALLGTSLGTVSADPFHVFTPLPGNVAGGALPESTPFQLANPNWSQRTIADRATQIANGQFNSGAWDMNTLNQNGPDAGRYLFTVFETAQAGVQRIDRSTNTATTIWQSPGAAPALNSHVAFDASFWTPWGTFLTAEESWRGNRQPQHLRPLVRDHQSPGGPRRLNLVHRDIIPECLTRAWPSTPTTISTTSTN